MSLTPKHVLFFLFFLFFSFLFFFIFFYSFLFIYFSFLSSLNLFPISKVMTHDNTSAVIPKFKEIWRTAGKQEKVLNPSQPIFTLDHNIQVKEERRGRRKKRRNITIVLLGYKPKKFRKIFDD